MVPEDFKKDRAAMSGGGFSSDALKAAVPFMRDQYRAHTQFLTDQLADGRAFWGGERAGTCRHPRLHEPVVHRQRAAASGEGDAGGISAVVAAWYERVRAIGHGTTERYDADGSAGGRQGGDLRREDCRTIRTIRNGRKPGDKVKVSADDYGRDPIAGEIVFSNAHEIAIRAARRKWAKSWCISRARDLSVTAA